MLAQVPQYQLMQMLKQMEVVDMEMVEAIKGVEMKMVEVTKEVVGPAMEVEAVEVEEETVTPTKTVPVMLHSAANTSSVEKQLSMEVMGKEEGAVVEDQDVGVEGVVAAMAVEVVEETQEDSGGKNGMQLKTL